MRKILFRGKTIKSMWADSEWVYGSLVIDGDNAFIVTENDYSNSYTDDRGVYDGDMTKVDITTVGQYTGLTANGKKMYEGDIVAGAVSWQERSKNGVVGFRDGSFGLIWYRGEIEQFVPFTSMCNVVLKIIGNIHDNPELFRTSQNDEVRE